jgi:hypothetical protein
MLDRIEIELTRIRREADHSGNRFLLYLLDMAILEANGGFRANTSGHAGDAADVLSPESGNSELRRGSVAERKVVQ